MPPAIWEIKRSFCRCIGISLPQSRRSRRSMVPGRRAVLIILAVVPLLAITKHTDAHKPVTSKYDYNRDVFPLLRDHCASCHVEDGPGPMSLMTYNEAVPWAES